jgi:alkylated DNA repair protein alkB family protein 6
MDYYDLPARTPALSLLLEPRSLVITTGEQYTARAHGIDAVAEDHVRASELANATMLSSGGSGRAVLRTEDGGDRNDGEVVVLRRETRYSLTCRDVARAMNVGMGIGTRRVV